MSSRVDIVTRGTSARTRLTLQVQAAPTPIRGSHQEIAGQPSKQPHVTFWHQPITEHSLREEESGLPAASRSVCGRCDATARSPGKFQCQEKYVALQKSELEHDFSRRKAYATTSFCWRQSPKRP